MYQLPIHHTTKIPKPNMTYTLRSSPQKDIKNNTFFIEIEGNHWTDNPFPLDTFLLKLHHISNILGIYRNYIGSQF